MFDLNSKCQSFKEIFYAMGGIYIIFCKLISATTTTILFFCTKHVKLTQL